MTNRPGALMTNRPGALMTNRPGPVAISQSDRAAFLADHRAISVQRFDDIHSPHYDLHWGTIGAMHALFVERFAQRVRDHGEVLDAACGTGKYWPMLLAARLRAHGIDQSAGMLAQASRKHSGVPTERRDLQSLQATTGLQARFDGLLCVDALECVAPEHWPGVARGLAATLRQGALAYVTIERWHGPLPAAADPRQLPGEVIEGGGYHYYPGLPQVRQWLSSAGFAVRERADTGDYWHLLLSRA